jgi:RimJ/RimL family protein N-acetyltransferase
LADLAIGAGGVSALERCCIGLPSLIILVAENQRAGADELERAGAAVNLGAAPTIAQVSDAVVSLCTDDARRVRMSTAAYRITDGFGAARVRLGCAPPLLLDDGCRIGLRPATMADTELMFIWQASPGARRFSRNPQSPEPSNHRRWLKAKLDDPDCVFNVITCGGEPAGILRFDRDPNVGAEVYEISILIAAEFQNRGVAAAALALGKLLLPGAQVRAAILPGNLASITLFEGAGYRRIAEQVWMFALTNGATKADLAG